MSESMLKAIEDFHRDKKKREEEKKKDPRYLKYLNHKAIPYGFELGFETFVVASNVLENIIKHWQDMKEDSSENITGILFGEKRDTQIEIKDCFKIKYSADGNIETDGGFYESDLEFLGIYSEGKILEETDVPIVAKLSESLKQSVFLIKFTWSEELNKISTTIFENVFDVCKESWQERLISFQLYRHPPHEGFIKSNIDSRVFYLIQDWSCASRKRFDPAVTSDQQSKLKGKLEIFDKRPNFDDYEEMFSEVAKNEGLSHEWDFYCLDPDDSLKIAQDICNKAKVDLRSTFKIPLDGGVVSCEVQVLNCVMMGKHVPSIKESHSHAIRCFFITIIRRKPEKVSI